MNQFTRTLTAAGALVTALTLTALHPVAEPIAAGPEAGKFAVDPVHSSVVFSVTHQGVSPAFGRFNKIDGSFELGEKAEASSVRIVIDAASVDTNSSDRDEHLRSPDFFNVKQYPEIVFESKSVKSTGKTTYDVIGELSFHGVTKEITIPMELVGSGDKGQFGYLAGFAGEVTIDRNDFGVSTYPGALGDKVRLLLGIEGRRE